MLKKEKQLQPQKEPKEKPFIIRHNSRSRSINGYIREFEKLEELREHKRSNSVSVYHYILSFSSKDKASITDALLKEMAAKFIELRGQDNLYIGTKHTDKEHIHLHLAMSAVDLAGRSTRISKANFEKLKLELDRYQKEHYPELIHSLPEHGRKGRESSRQSIVEHIQSARSSEKAGLLQILESTYKASRSLDQFLEQLSDQGYSQYYRSGALAGITTESGRKYRLAGLGYSKEKLGELDLLQAQDKALAELRSLRERPHSARTILQKEAPAVKDLTEADSQALQELQSIREQAADSRSRDNREEPSSQPDRAGEMNKDEEQDQSDNRSDRDSDDSRDR